MDWLKQALVNMIQWIGQLFKNTFKALWDILRDVFAWVLEQLLDMVVSAVSAIDTSGLQGVEAWGSLPSEVLNVLGLLGIGAASGVIVAAIGIRLVLQLIPFVRLGS